MGLAQGRVSAKPMTLVSPTVPNAGDEANATDISTPINQLAAVINGGIDDSNIASVSGSKVAAGTVNTAQLTDSGVTTAKIAANAVSADKLATNSILLANAKMSSNQTFTAATNTQITALTTTVTIPSGGRSVRVKASIRATSDTNLRSGILTLWDGAVGTTQIQQGEIFFSNGGFSQTLTIDAIVTPTAGSKTYNASYAIGNGASTHTITGGTTVISYLSVELV